MWVVVVRPRTYSCTKQQTRRFLRYFVCGLPLTNNRFALYPSCIKSYRNKKTSTVTSSKNVNISSKIPKRVGFLLFTNLEPVAWETLLVYYVRRWRRQRRRRRWRGNVTRRKGGDFRWLQGKTISQTTYTPSCSIIGSVHDDVVLLSLLKYRGAHTTTYNIMYARVHIRYILYRVSSRNRHRPFYTV